MGSNLNLPIDEIPDGLLICDRGGLIKATNAALQRMFGYGPEELAGRAVEMLVPLRYGQHRDLRSNYMDHKASRPMGNVQRIFGLRKDGSEIPLDITLRPGDANGDVLCFARDVSEHVKLSEQVRKAAYFDTLTGALNRRAFNEDLTDVLTTFEMHQDGVCIALFDLDYFKTVNETLGHTAGDNLLIIFCERLQQVMGERMRLYRTGGDEFALIIHGCGDRQTAMAFVENALWHLRKPVKLGGHEISVAASAGVVLAPGDGQHKDVLLSNAGLALYRAKIDRGSVSTFSPDLREIAEDRFLLMGDLRSALENNEFELYFQPKIELRSGRISGAEALLRWNHPRRGLLTPASFIDLIANDGMSLSIGRWILTEACQKAREWQNLAGDRLHVAVNLFPRQLDSRNLINDVRHALSVSGLDPKALELEVTENTIMDSCRRRSEAVGFLRDLGVRFALDDFGTGFASLNTLTDLSFDTIKVERSFVSDIANNAGSRTVLKAVVMLAREFNLASVAEGVESPEEEEMVGALGFDLAQGYNWSPAVTHDAFLDMLRVRGRRASASASALGRLDGPALPQ